MYIDFYSKKSEYTHKGRIMKQKILILLAIIMTFDLVYYVYSLLPAVPNEKINDGANTSGAEDICMVGVMQKYSSTTKIVYMILSCMLIYVISVSIIRLVAYYRLHYYSQ